MKEVDVAKNLLIREMRLSDWPQIAKIYAEGIATGHATFEKDVPTWQSWDASHIKACRLVGEINGQLTGWAALSPVSSRYVYTGVAESSIYISEAFRGKKVGETLLNALIAESETHGFWTLQAGVFPENTASTRLHLKCGYRLVGIREKIGLMNGVWRNNQLLERRSKFIGITTMENKKNVLVLCTGNSCRSQMAHGYLNHFGNEKLNVYSAGIETHGVNSRAIAIMKEDGVDISTHTSNHVDEYLGIDFDYIITVCDHAKENCPFIPSKNAVRIHHNFFDPSKLKGTEEEIHAAFKKARNEIKAFASGFVTELK